MCGFAGIYEFARRTPAVEMSVLIDMRDSMVHRGPDGAGAWVSQDRRIGLAHRRLAIVDPDHGSQPMFGPSGECLVFNGEIYNYQRLRSKLERDGVQFATDCDTEVILHLYARKGLDCLADLDGMFAFALWDPVRECLFFARDRIGEKPLYWTVQNGRLLVASEIKALLKDPTVTAAVNEGALESYFAHLVVPAPQTLFAGIYKLEPGTYGLCDREGVRVSRYWTTGGDRRWRSDSLEQSTLEVRRLLERSVEDRLMSDVRVGILLSGGVDSTTLLALLRERAHGFATFSVGFSDQPGLDERGEARRAARELGSDHHEVEVSQNQAIAFLPELIHHQDEPLGDPVCVPLSFVCKLARDAGVKVVLAGEGADELFWGYPAYRQVLAQWKWRQAILRLPPGLRRRVPSVVSAERHPFFHETLEGLATGRALPMHVPLGASRHHRRMLLRHGENQALCPGWAPGQRDNDLERPLDTLGFDTQEYEFAIRLPELLLMRIDRFSMAHSVEARVPFLAPELVRYAYALPPEQKMRDGVGKIVLRQAIADIVPEWVLARPKQGFGAPMNRWLASHLGDVLERMLSGPAAARYLNRDVLERRLRILRSSSKAPAFPLWPVLNFLLWHRLWIEGESLEPVLGPPLEALSS